MAAIDEIVQVQISIESATIDKVGFGTPLIAGFHSAWPQRVRSFGSITELSDAGIPTTHPIYKCVVSLLSQEFKVPLFKVGKRLLGNTHVLRITPLNTDEGTVYSFNAAIGNGVATPITHTNGAAESVAGITLALQSQIDAITDITAIDNSTDVTVTADNAGELVRLWGFDLDTLEVDNLTTDPGIATDLDAIEAADGNWYGLLLDSNSSAEVLAAAAWTQPKIKLFLSDSSDSDVIDPLSTSDVMYLLNASSYTRTVNLFDQDDTLGYGGAAWMGDQFPQTPGEATWKFKSLSGPTTDSVGAAGRAAIRAKKGNFYHSISGLPITEEGTVASGQFIDIIWGIDWLQAEVQTNVLVKLASSKKVPYTDAGVDSIRAEVLRALNQGITNSLISEDPKPEVTAPRVADVAPADKSNRLLPDVGFTGQVAGAVHKVIVQGRLAV